MFIFYSYFHIPFSSQPCGVVINCLNMYMRIFCGRQIKKFGQCHPEDGRFRDFILICPTARPVPLLLSITSHCLFSELRSAFPFTVWDNFLLYLIQVRLPAQTIFSSSWESRRSPCIQIISQDCDLSGTFISMTTYYGLEASKRGRQTMPQKTLWWKCQSTQLCRWACVLKTEKFDTSMS